METIENMLSHMGFTLHPNNPDPSSHLYYDPQEESEDGLYTTYVLLVRDTFIIGSLIGVMDDRHTKEEVSELINTMNEQSLQVRYLYDEIKEDPLLLWMIDGRTMIPAFLIHEENQIRTLWDRHLNEVKEQRKRLKNLGYLEEDFISVTK